MGKRRGGWNALEGFLGASLRKLAVDEDAGGEGDLGLVDGGIKVVGEGRHGG